MEEIWKSAFFTCAVVIFSFLVWAFYLFYCGQNALKRFDQGFSIYCNNGTTAFMVDHTFHLDVDRTIYIRDDHAFHIYDCK